MFGSKIIPPKQANYVQPGPMAPGGGGGLMKQMAGMGLKTALAGSPIAPLAGVLGGLFNNGGRVGAQHMMPDGSMMAGAVHRNMGGPLSQMPRAPHPNPMGYNEGGAVGQTPMKLVMDEQKLEQNAMAFELDQKRKQEAHDMAMKQKQQQFAEAQKLKKQQSMTNKKPTKPKGPLSK